MPKTVSAAQARNNFADLIGEAHFGDETFIIERLGKPFAVVLGYKEYQRMMRQLQRRQRGQSVGADATDQARLF